MPLRHKKKGWNERLVDYWFCSTREVSANQLPIETIVAPVGKNEPALDLQTDISFGDNGEAFDYIKSIVIGRNLRINMPHGSTCR